MRRPHPLVKPRLTFLVLACALLTGCVPESSGTDALCQWRPDSRHRGNLSPEQLSADAEKAEDLAVRYADGHGRPGTNPGSTSEHYHRTIDQCMDSLFQAVANQHHVTPQEVRGSINKHRSTSLDVAVMLSFGLLYAYFVNRFVRGIWRRFPPKRDRLLGILATAVIAPIAGLLGGVAGELWAFQAECIRIGYGHLVGRFDRTLWARDRPGILVAGIIIFWTLSWLRYQEAESAGESRATVLGLDWKSAD